MTELSKGVTLLVPEDDARRYAEWTSCEAFRFAPVEDGTVRFEVRGIPPADDRECDWCAGKGYAVQVGPGGQSAQVPCVNCDGTGRLDA